MEGSCVIHRVWGFVTVDSSLHARGFLRARAYREMGLEPMPIDKCLFRAAVACFSTNGSLVSRLWNERTRSGAGEYAYTYSELWWSWAVL